VLDAEALAQLAHLRGHRGRIPRIAGEYLHRDGTALCGADQAEDDLRIVALAVARVTASGQLATASGQPGRGQVVQHERGAHQVLTGQAARLGLMQPVQRLVQVLDTAPAHPEHPAERGVGGVVVQQAMRCELGCWRDHARDQHRQQQRLQLLGRRTEPACRATAARAAEHGRHVAVRQGAFDGEDLGRTGYSDAAAKQRLQAFDHLGG
jgi:hypothetical protein